MTYLTPDQLCEMYQIKRGKLYRMTSTGSIPYFKVGNELRFDPTQVKNAFMQRVKKINI